MCGPAMPMGVAHDGPVEAVPGGARRGVSAAFAGLAQDLLLVLSQPTRCSTFAAGEGWRCPPSDPPKKGPRSEQGSRVAGDRPAGRGSGPRRRAGEGPPFPWARFGVGHGRYGHPPPSRRRSWPSRKGLLEWERPEAAGGGMRIPTARDARTGHRNRRVAPIHGPMARIGTGGSAAVAQHQGGQPHAAPARCASHERIACTRTPMSHAHRSFGIGNSIVAAIRCRLFEPSEAPAER